MKPYTGLRLGAVVLGLGLGLSSGFDGVACFDARKDIDRLTEAITDIRGYSETAPALALTSAEFTTLFLPYDLEGADSLRRNIQTARIVSGIEGYDLSINFDTITKEMERVRAQRVSDLAACTKAKNKSIFAALALVVAAIPRKRK